MTIDKYTKVILSLIAVGILGINFYLFEKNIIKQAQAISYTWNKSDGDVIYLGRGVNGYQILSSDGKYFCQFEMESYETSKYDNGKWEVTSCEY